MCRSDGRGLVQFVYKCQKLRSLEIEGSDSLARWSRGMILASSARSPGFKSQTSPEFLLYEESKWFTGQAIKANTPLVGSVNN